MRSGRGPGLGEGGRRRLAKVKGQILIFFPKDHNGPKISAAIII